MTRNFAAIAFLVFYVLFLLLEFSPMSSGHFALLVVGLLFYGMNWETVNDWVRELHSDGTAWQLIQGFFVESLFWLAALVVVACTLLTFSFTFIFFSTIFSVLLTGNASNVLCYGFVGSAISWIVLNKRFVAIVEKRKIVEAYPTL